MFKKTITSDFFTTISFRQAFLSLIFMSFGLPWIKYGKYIKQVEEELLLFLNLKKSKIISLYNGRSAIYQALKIAGIGENDEVILPGYTCVSVVNAVLQSSAKIIYSDIEKKTLGLDVKKLEKNITKKTKVIIVQHTFGKASQIEKISKIAKENNILIIEDCAHSLGNTVDDINYKTSFKSYPDKYLEELKSNKLNKEILGSFGDFSIFSTGRDKVISSVTGGFLIINNKKYFTKIEEIKNKLKMPTLETIIKDLNYNIVAYKAYKWYDFFSMGKIVIHFSRKLKLINEIIDRKEKNCKSKSFDLRLPNSLAFLALKELKRIKIYSKNRYFIQNYYDENIKNDCIEKILSKNTYFQYPILLKNKKIKDELYDYMKKNNILLGKNWSQTNIVPLGINKKNTLYKEGICKIAEDMSSRILTLPIHYLLSTKDLERVVWLLNNFKKD